ncbi:acetyl-CoA synthetase [miscellaneous Crenarchaeota group-15 archaeon DG-45]|uniref:Acetyl-CoA synthetase n=1 Tax=miscellaneous Crenarchaeota group-15 archaeon DG-45 TaxID=1685127 RepID=A0A0M0BP31_9ARCH|nr:MAG: acetyl-CoA synthetase [miscellaneous Crenarchaeota group-15 archaeon DG-45]
MRSEAVSRIFEEARLEGRGFLFEHEAKRLCSLYGMPVARSVVARTEDEAAAVAVEMGFPVVLKVVSPQILHKSDAGGVLVGVGDEEAVRAGYRRIIENVGEKAPEAEIRGILVQEMASSSTEVIVGSTRDPTFGPVIMFGLGGIFVEVLEDVSFRLVPITRADAEEMVREIRAYRILEGVRGMPKADQGAIVDILLSASRMLMECPEIEELDLNPVLVYEEGAMIVDARVILA